MSRENKISRRSNHLCWKQYGLSLTSPPKGSRTKVSVAGLQCPHLCDTRHSKGGVADPAEPTYGLLEFRLLPIFPTAFKMRWGEKLCPITRFITSTKQQSQPTTTWNLGSHEPKDAFRPDVVIYLRKFWLASGKLPISEPAALICSL